jgi:hypothetical protein
MINNLGPPGAGDGSGPASPRREPDHTASAAAKHLNNASLDGHDHTLTGLRRRRTASRRMERLACGCGTRDPWICRCDRSPMSEKFIDAGAQAAHHLRDVGCAPLLELDVLRALWRRGGDDRQLARQLYELVGGDGA